MINLQGIDFAYGKQDLLFKNLTLDLVPGTITGLLGKNGAGKTTLLKLIAGLIFPTTGTVQVSNFCPMDRAPSFLSDTFFVAEEFYLPLFPSQIHPCKQFILQTLRFAVDEKTPCSSFLWKAMSRLESFPTGRKKSSSFLLPLRRDAGC